MKREILFRGKRIDNGEWVEGFLADSCYGLVILPKLNNGETSLYHVDGNEWNVCSYEILPETIGQFTGLTDINGKEIFEGDIYNMGDKNILYVVVWRDCGLIGKQLGSTSYAGVEYWKEKIEIIGNIHDNPEFL